jgi:SAM-dependent methyltransferase
MNNKVSDKIKKLQNIYPWLKITTKVEDYVSPDYYDKLLKEYSFNGKTDLDIFSQELESLNKTGSILELGCGTGRGTQVLVDNLEFDKLTLVDLSTDMVKKTRNRFSEINNIKVINSDSLTFLKETKEKYDFVFSLWSYSHSVYQMFEKLGQENGIKEVKNILKKFFDMNMSSGSKFFLIHSDWLSDEQKILIEQWGREMPDLYGRGGQGTSKLLLDEVFNEMKSNGLIEWSVTHYLGDPIEYDSLEDAMETFINFHLESYFNDTKYLPEVVDSVKKYLSNFIQKDDKVRVRPACFIYRCLVK